MNANYYAVIMAGGIGSRFWPFSRTHHPKQFHDVLGVGRTMLQQTADRFAAVCPPENVYIVTNRSYYQLVKDQLPHLTDDQILLEPVGRNTAPCVAYAAYKISQRNPDATMVVAPSDHVILQQEAFERQILKGLDAAHDTEKLITLGIRPSRPDTGYGYIQYRETSDDDLRPVKTFTEKPHLELAQKFVESGDFVWNAGIFIWSASTICRNFERHLPDVADLFEEGRAQYYQPGEAAFVEQAYPRCKNISIDYGIMEKADSVFVLLSDFGWSDLGTWKSLYEISEKKDEHGNVVGGKAMLYDTHNCIVKNDPDHLVVVQGLDNFIVAQHDNVVMICPKDQEQRVKDFVSELKVNKQRKFI